MSVRDPEKAQGLKKRGVRVRQGDFDDPASLAHTFEGAWPVAWTAHSDLAEVAAMTLSEEVLDGVTPVLTASEAIDLEGVAALASELAHRPIRRIVVPDAEFRAGLVAQHFPEAIADMLLGMYHHSPRDKQFVSRGVMSLL